MTDEERAATYERMHRNLEDAFERKQEYEERAAANRQARLAATAGHWERDERGWPVYHEPAAVKATQRAPEGVISKDDLRRAIRHERELTANLVETIVAGLRAEIASAIKANTDKWVEIMGGVVSHERGDRDGLLDGLRKEFEGKIAECRLEYLDNLTKIFGVCDRMEKSAGELSAKADELAELPSERRRRKQLPH